MAAADVRHGLAACDGGGHRLEVGGLGRHAETGRRRSTLLHLLLGGDAPQAIGFAHNSDHKRLSGHLAVQASQIHGRRRGRRVHCQDVTFAESRQRRDACRQAR
ncbi:MAG: hypothetical protein AB2L07_20840 [Thermoanaerobaculaceae bacterium]